MPIKIKKQHWRKKAKVQIMPGLPSVGENCSRISIWRTILWDLCLGIPHCCAVCWDRTTITFSILVGPNSCIIRALIFIRRSEGLFCPPGTWGDVWRLSSCHSGRGIARDAAKHPSRPTTKESQTPNTNSAEAEKSCLRDFTAYRS